MEFPGFLGNAQVKEALSRAGQAGRFPHALLLCGEPGCGKRTFARLLAQAGLCRPCRESAWPQASAVLYSAHPRRRLGEQALYQILRSLKQQAHHT